MLGFGLALAIKENNKATNKLQNIQKRLEIVFFSFTI